jgi:DNA-binding MarR family transcriptional regulator
MLAEQSRSLSQLASMQHLRLPTISNTITSLEERGWVTRTRSQTDRRVILVALTPQGESALQVVHKHAESYIAGLLTAISEEEEETLRRGLATLHGVFEGALQSESTARSDIHHPG